MAVTSRRLPSPRTETQEPPASLVLRRMIDGYQLSQALYVVATLGVADLLAGGPRTSAELAEAVGAHPVALYRVLRALASVGVLHELDGAWFALTSLGDCLRSDAQEPVGAWAAFVGRSYRWQAWAHLLDSVRTGEYAFRQVHGLSGWDYRVRNPQENAIFDRAMTDLSRRASRAIVEAYNFGRHTTVVDVGGGRGALLAAILTRYPAVRGMLFDLPHVVADSPPLLEAAGVAERCQVVGGSFFDGVPAGADAYLLKMVLHDWDDEHAVRILRACRQASKTGGALVIVEWDLGPRNAARDAKFSDLEMLVGNGGLERSVDQYSALLTRSGFHLERSSKTRIGFSVLEANAV